MVEAQNANVSVNTLVKHKAVALPTRSSSDRKLPTHNTPRQNAVTPCHRMVEPTTTTPELPDICHRYRWAFSRPSTDFICTLGKGNEQFVLAGLLLEYHT
ncbi:hypothetical protein Pst134EA_011097 [Puccinia striiformis f. sp. tritici]|uniref:hypothetical protein n=1 Tax=Puccinia striiformis f. sp. tritici TaxID=168172 RepID=UPI002008DD37|nr:hypothetical protein Pst134EA_011097 [Puccinia striiformis f. sp. tritici]KAH9467453.1 hypothetical protein Pst134EA_011097 [Puccinia striiformis f. sp. tritici]